MTATAIPALRAPRISWARTTDESLARRAASGDSAAFTAIYERYHGPLLAYCRSILLDAEDARDATQSALESALRALPRREPGRPLRPWLYRIAHNEAINIVRRRRPAADVDPATVLTVPGPEVDSEQRSRLTQLVDDLQALPERQRGALVMRELSGLSYDEIAETLGVSGEAARRAVFDARSALHAAIDGRATACVSVRRSLSDGDRRHLRARGIRAHLRSCDDCAIFERAMGARQNDLHALGTWLGGAGALGLVGFGAGGAGAASGATLLAAATGGAAAAGGGGLGWAGLPVAAKGLAVAAVVATTGTAAVELPKATRQDAPAPAARAATTAGAKIAAAPVTVSPTFDPVREQARARAEAARERSAATISPGRSRARPGSSAQAAPAPAAPAPAPAAPAPAVAAPPPQPVVDRPSPSSSAQARQPSRGRPARAPAGTPQQIAIAGLQRVREQVAAAFAQAQATAASGRPSAVKAADAMIQQTLASVRPTLERILASVGLRLPAAATPTAPSSPSPSTALAPAQSMLGSVDSLLSRLFGRARP